MTEFLRRYFSDAYSKPRSRGKTKPFTVRTSLPSYSTVPSCTPVAPYVHHIAHPYPDATPPQHPQFTRQNHHTVSSILLQILVLAKQYYTYYFTPLYYYYALLKKYYQQYSYHWLEVALCRSLFFLKTRSSSSLSVQEQLLKKRNLHQTYKFFKFSKPGCSCSQYGGQEKSCGD